MALYNYQIATGYNNAAGLVNIENITPSGSRAFDAPDGLSKYRPGGQAIIRGNGTITWTGYPSTEWEWSLITLQQVRYLMTTYCASGYSGLVTIKTQTDNIEVYANFNAVMTLTPLPEFPLLYPEIAPYKVRFTRMVAL